MNHLPLCLGAVLSCVSLAHAESNGVDLYGVIDSGVTYVNNAVTNFPKGVTPSGGALWATPSGILQGSRWGLRGTEELGGGMRAVFTLENGFDISSGTAAQSGRLFGRQAFVGLSNEHGSITLGRQYDPMVSFVSPQSAAFQWGGLYAAHWGNLDNMTPFSRDNNSIELMSASVGGVKLGGIYSFGGRAGQFANGNAWGLGGAYTNGPFRFGVAYTLANNPYTPDTSTSSSALSDPGSLGLNASFPYANLLKTRQQNNLGISGSYQFGKVTLGLVYTKVRLLSSQILTAAGNDVSFDTYEINTAWRPSPSFMLGAEYAYTAGDVSGGGVHGGDLRPGFHQITLLGDYFLSVRTDVYMQGVAQLAVGDGIAAFPGGPREALAQINTLAPSSTRRQLALRVGLRHTF
jgi:predicted porin